MAKMRAAQVTRPNGPLEIVEREIPQPSAGSVRVKVEACGVCHSDSLTKEGILDALGGVLEGQQTIASGQLGETDDGLHDFFWRVLLRQQRVLTDFNAPIVSFCNPHAIATPAYQPPADGHQVRLSMQLAHLRLPYPSCCPSQVPVNGVRNSKQIAVVFRWAENSVAGRFPSHQQDIYLLYRSLGHMGYRLADAAKRIAIHTSGRRK